MFSARTRVIPPAQDGILGPQHEVERGHIAISVGVRATAGPAGNLKAAKALGVTVPLTLLGRADEVIE